MVKKLSNNIGEYIFVSCDIIAHSAEPSIKIQQQRVAAINSIVSKKIKLNSAIIWASGGDGGHVAFPSSCNISLSLDLIIELCNWSLKSNTKLRITASVGKVSCITGADNRKQLVGEGINLSGRILPYASSNRIVVTKEYQRRVVKIKPKGIVFHDKRTLKPSNISSVDLYLLSVNSIIESSWYDLPLISDRECLANAIKTGDALNAIYHIKRIFDVNPLDLGAEKAVRQLARYRAKMLLGKEFLEDLIIDEQFGPSVLRAGTLIERKKGSILCDYGDDGNTMFWVLKGCIGVILPQKIPSKFTLQGKVLQITSGELFGELAFALQRKRTATLFCLEETILLAYSYKELFNSVSSEQAKKHLAEALDRRILSRIIENFWNMSLFVNVVRQNSDLNVENVSWLQLLEHSSILQVSLTSNSIAKRFFYKNRSSLYFLVSGTVVRSIDNQVLIGDDYPLLYSSVSKHILPNDLSYRLEKECKILCIEEEGFIKLGAHIYHAVNGQINNFSQLMQNGGKVMPSKPDNKHIFLSYCHENNAKVQELHAALIDKGINVWWDHDILAGENIQYAIREAMKRSYAIIFCLSNELLTRKRSGVYPELRDAIRIYREYSPGNIFLITVRLSAFEIPSIEIDSNTTLDGLKYVDFFGDTEERKNAITTLIKSIQKARLNH